MTELSLNHVQADIMRRLFERDGQRFSEINTAKIPTDQFSYHLRQLAKAKLIEKLPDQTYRLTNRGRSKTIILSPTGNTFIEQGLIAVLLAVSKQENGRELFLAHQRNKVPHKGKIGFFGDKIRFGENMLAAAKRTLIAQTGLTGNPELRSMWHLVDKFEGTIVEDKYFFIYSVTQFEGELKPVGITGENTWMTQKEMEDSGKMFHTISGFIESVKSPKLTCHELVTEIDSY